MCAAIANWYTSQYGTWNRTRRLQVPPYVATENNVSRTQSRLAADALVLNMNEVDSIIHPSSRQRAADDAIKNDDTLFGPGVGVISSGPKWAESSTVTAKDEISPDILKSWLTKSKDTSIPTTTLQALVNLKRPSIKLSPLASTADTTDNSAHMQHGLEFEFDCDAPKCSIKMFVIGQQGSTGRLLVFQTMVGGGFNRSLKYDEGAVLELAALELPDEEPTAAISPPAGLGAMSDFAKSAETGVARLSSGGVSAHDEHINSSVSRGRKRFSHFPFKRRNGATHQQVAGPALPVIDVDIISPAPNEMSPEEASTDGLQREKEENGIKVVIEIEAMDDEGSSLTSPNSQLTYLHIVRMGAAPVGEEDRRPWMVKVVKREARIGSHSFHLHEIYGLSSTTSSAQIPTTEHSYPPTDQINDEQTSECLLCLSSPREVVLLPCRHLVACRECAINMVEFGAGGTLVHMDLDPPTTSGASRSNADQANNSGGSNEVNNGSNNTSPVAQPAPPRRKRKAKGWFCPVCRQPYTSLLRITATPPEKECRISPTVEDNIELPEVTSSAVTEPTAAADTRSFFPRSNFLRSFSRPGSRPSTGNASNMV